MNGSHCLYRFVKMRSSSAIPPKLVRSAGAAGAEAGPAAAAEAAEAEKDAEEDGDEVEVEESEDAAPVVDAALLFLFVCSGEGSADWNRTSQHTCSRNYVVHLRAGKRSGKRRGVRDERRKKERKNEGKRESSIVASDTAAAATDTECFLFLFLVPKQGRFFFSFVSPA